MTMALKSAFLPAECLAWVLTIQLITSSTHICQKSSSPWRHTLEYAGKSVGKRLQRQIVGEEHFISVQPETGWDDMLPSLSRTSRESAFLFQEFFLISGIHHTWAVSFQHALIVSSHVFSFSKTTAFPYKFNFTKDSQISLKCYSQRNLALAHRAFLFLWLNKSFPMSEHILASTKHLGNRHKWSSPSSESSTHRPIRCSLEEEFFLVLG